MAAYNALVDSYATAPAPAPPVSDGSFAATMGPSPNTMGPHIADLQGTPPLSGDHNIPLHVGFLGLLALGLVVLFRVLGFRFSLAGNLGLGKG